MSIESPAAPASGHPGIVRLSLARLGAVALEAISPTRCAGCERPGPLVCERCRAAFKLIDPKHACTSCGAPFGELVCTECRGEPAELDLCLAAASFEGPLRRVIRMYKDAGERRLAHVLGEMIARAAERAAAEAPDRFGGVLADADAIVFIPVTFAALRRRGFDHMEAVAQSVCRMCGAPVLDALAKRGSSDQRRLDRIERRARSADAYVVTREVFGLRLALLDDVITTGATMNAAAAALRRAGAARVEGVAVARVW